jgi:hypothetical protein
VLLEEVDLDVVELVVVVDVPFEMPTPSYVPSSAITSA